MPMLHDTKPKISVTKKGPPKPSRTRASDYETELVMATDLKIAQVRGLPGLFTEDDYRFSPLLAKIKEQGFPGVVLADKSNHAWTNRAALAVAQHLDIEVPIQRIDEAQGEQAALRDLVNWEWSLLDRIDFILHVDKAGLAEASPGKKRNEQISNWLQTTLGWRYGFSPRNVQKYLKMEGLADVARQKIASADTIHEAERMLDEKESDDTKHEEGDEEEPDSKPLIVRFKASLTKLVPVVKGAEQLMLDDEAKATLQELAEMIERILSR